MTKTITLGIMLLLVLTAVPVAFAAADNEVLTTVTPAGKEYDQVQQITDRINLWLAFKDSQKLEVMSRIQTRRAAHYDFLMDNGKTDQAAKFQAGTVALMTKFNEQRTRIQERAKAKLEAASKK